MIESQLMRNSSAIFDYDFVNKMDKNLGRIKKFLESVVATCRNTVTTADST
jgi:hypothetical protein